MGMPYHRLEVAINWDASLTSKHRALELLAQMVAGEWPASIPEALQTWGPHDLTTDEIAALQEVFPETAAFGTKRQTET